MTAHSRIVAAAVVLVLITGVVYHGSLHAPFVFDDRAAILENESIRQLWPLTTVLSPPPGGQSVSGRPLVNLSLALNHAIGGVDPFGYHVFNVLLHALAGLALFGLVRRTWPAPANGGNTLLAFAIALLWLVHPLQTAAVSYVVQRAEAMTGLFYLLTTYCFVRGVSPQEAERGTGVPAVKRDHGRDARAAAKRAFSWLGLSIIACLLGMATKEVMVTAPFAVLLYDRTFVSGGFVAAWRQRRGYYVALASTWLMLGWLLLGNRARGGTVGFGSGISSWQYLLTQGEAVALYLKLSVWPDPLVFDRGEHLVTSLGQVLPQATLVVTLLVATIYALARHPKAGFLGAWFFVVLAPTSSLVPIASQTVAEHRMYLPLAAVIAAVAALGWRWLRRWTAGVLLGLSVVAGGLTMARNATYRSEIDLWRGAAQHAPENPRAHANLGNALLDAGRFAEAVPAYEAALRLQPNSADLHANLCQGLTRLGRFADAVRHGEAAIRLDPTSAAARLNLAAALIQLGRLDEAATHQLAARRLQPELAELGRAAADTLIEESRQLAQAGAWSKAQERITAALQAAPDYAEGYFAAGNLAAAQDDFRAAVAAYEAALARDPAHLRARNNLANALLVSGRIEEAIRQYREVLQRRPGDQGVEANLQRALELQATRSTPAR